MAGNYADIQTDKELMSLENRLREVYQHAYTELGAMLDHYLESFEKEDSRMRDLVNAKAISRHDYILWRQNHIGIGQRWTALRADIAHRITNVNEIASKYINDVTPNIYAMNANYEAFTIEQRIPTIMLDGGIEAPTSFTLVRESTVRNLAIGYNQTEFRVTSIDPQRDYEWNTKKIQNALMSGILQGRGMTSIAEAFYSVMGNNYKAAVRNARTAITSAQNAGKQHTMTEATNMGIECKNSGLPRWTCGLVILTLGLMEKPLERTIISRMV